LGRGKDAEKSEGNWIPRARTQTKEMRPERVEMTARKEVSKVISQKGGDSGKRKTRAGRKPW